MSHRQTQYKFPSYVHILHFLACSTEQNKILQHKMKNNIAQHRKITELYKQFFFHTIDFANTKPHITTQHNEKQPALTPTQNHLHRKFPYKNQSKRNESIVPQ